MHTEICDHLYILLFDTLMYICLSSSEQSDHKNGGFAMSSKLKGAVPESQWSWSYWGIGKQCKFLMRISARLSVVFIETLSNWNIAWCSQNQISMGVCVLFLWHSVAAWILHLWFSWLLILLTSNGSALVPKKEILGKTHAKNAMHFPQMVPNLLVRSSRLLNVVFNMP